MADDVLVVVGSVSNDTNGITAPPAERVELPYNFC